jgi:replicative DNA helicase
MKIYTGQTITSEELGEAFRELLKERQLNPDNWRGLKFGHPDLDKITGGLRKGEFAVVAGAQKAGKTTVALAWSERFAEQVQPGELVLFVSLEMSHDSIAGRVLANLSDIDVTKFRDYKLEEGDWKKLDVGVEKMGKLPILWNTGAYSIDGIESLVSQYENRVRVVVVDYFQLMSGGDRTAKRYEQLTEISRRLKALTLTYDLSVLAVSQQSREALKSLDRQKDSNTMADTQSLARDCDLLVLILPYIDKGEEVPHMRKLHISIARNSLAGATMNAIFSGQYCRFGGVAETDIAQMPEVKEKWWTK